jgi:hypothetical protein
LSFAAFVILTLVFSCSVWTRKAEQTSLSFDEPHFLPTCEYPFFISLQVANRGRVSVSDWHKLIPASSLSNQPMSGGSIDPDPYSEFTLLSPPRTVEKAAYDVDGAPEPGSAIAKYYTPSDFDAPSSGRSPVSCGSLQFFKSFSLLPLLQHPSCDLYSDDHILRNSVRSLDEGEDPIFSLPAAWTAAFGVSDTCLGQGTGAPPAREDDEAVLRTSIRSLDIGEEPVFELPSGWKEAFVSASHVAVPSLSRQPETAKTSVLPKIKSLWKRATSKFTSRRV